jgi:hypothetical protein
MLEREYNEIHPQKLELTDENISCFLADVWENTPSGSDTQLKQARGMLNDIRIHNHLPQISNNIHVYPDTHDTLTGIRRSNKRKAHKVASKNTFSPEQLTELYMEVERECSIGSTAQSYYAIH